MSKKNSKKKDEKTNDPCVGPAKALIPTEWAEPTVNSIIEAFNGDSVGAAYAWGAATALFILSDETELPSEQDMIAFLRRCFLGSYSEHILPNIIDDVAHCKAAVVTMKGKVR